MKHSEVYKTFHGNKIESNEMIDEVRRLELEVYTMKTSSGYVTTNASVSVISEDGRSKTHAMFTDFHKRIFAEKYGRVTARVLKEQHMRTPFEEIVREAKEFYKVV